MTVDLPDKLSDAARGHQSIAQGTISQPLMLVEEKTDRPDVAGLQWSLWADILAGVPGAPYMHGRIKV
jgi:hypothetical protein